MSIHIADDKKLQTNQFFLNTSEQLSAKIEAKQMQDLRHGGLEIGDFITDI